MLDSALFGCLPSNAREEFRAEEKNVFSDKEKRDDLIRALRICYEAAYRAKREGVLVWEGLIADAFEWNVPAGEFIDTLLFMRSEAIDIEDCYAVTYRHYISCASSCERFFTVFFAIALLDKYEIGMNEQVFVKDLLDSFSVSTIEFATLREDFATGKRLPIASPVIRPKSGKNVKWDFWGGTSITRENFYSYVFCDTLCIPGEITEVNWYACADSMHGIDFVLVEPKSKSFKVIDGNVYNGDGTELLFWTAEEPVADIPEGVKRIGEHVFSYKQNLERINFPSTLSDFDHIHLDFYDSPKIKTVSFKGDVVDFSVRSHPYLRDCVLEELIFYSKKPPVLKRELFLYGNSFPKLTVPEESVALYKSAPDWKRYAKIIDGGMQFEEKTKKNLLGQNKLFMEVYNGFSLEKREQVFQNAQKIVDMFEERGSCLKWFGDGLIEREYMDFIKAAKEKGVPCVDFLQRISGALSSECYISVVEDAMEKEFASITDLEERYYAFLWKLAFGCVINDKYHYDIPKILKTYIPECKIID